jgi:hypothetical protein
MVSMSFTQLRTKEELSKKLLQKLGPSAKKGPRPRAPRELENIDRYDIKCLCSGVYVG